MSLRGMLINIGRVVVKDADRIVGRLVVGYGRSVCLGNVFESRKLQDEIAWGGGDVGFVYIVSLWIGRAIDLHQLG